MLTRLLRVACNKIHLKSTPLQLRNTSNAVSLANTEYLKNEPVANPFIIMHGLFGSKSNWNSLCKAFAQKTSPPRKIISIDARNHGESPHTAEHSYHLMSEDISQFFKEKQIEKAAVLGHSMGGRAMMYFTLRYPQLVEKLVVVDISPVSPLGTSRTDIPLFLEAMRSIELQNDLTIHQGRKVADERLSEIISEKSLRDFLITNLAKSESDGFRWRINIETLEKCFEEGVANFPECSGMQFKGPTLFIGGSKSDYLRPSDKPKISQLFPNSEMVYLDAGHWVHAEKPEEFSKQVLNFLNQA